MRTFFCTLRISKAAKSIVSTLESKGFSAYLVGGCVRDTLLGKRIKDYDIATSATPNEVMDIFSDSVFFCIPVGAQFGTIALCHKDTKQQYEVTTFRTDGFYKDNRKPDTVAFINDIQQDLLRRDFSINALAYQVGRTSCIIDYVGGLKDLKKQKIVCVGNPNVRFNEDSLRILRALRFSATLGFSIQKRTHKSLMQNTQLLRNLSAERIASELDKMLVGKDFVRVFKTYNDIFVFIFSKYCHISGLASNEMQHIAKDLSRFKGLKEDILLCARWACILAFVEKHKNGGAGQILQCLKYPNAFAKKILLFVRFYDVDIAIKQDRKLRIALKNLLREMGVEVASEFIAFKMRVMKKKHIVRLKKAFDVVSKECFNLQRLCIKGDDLSVLNLSGKQIGTMLEILLQEVINDKCANQKEVLITRATKIIQNGEHDWI